MAGFKLDCAGLMEALSGIARTQILGRYRHMSRRDIHTKSSAIDLVTVADQLIEKQLASYLGREYPDALVIGEEAATANGALLDKLSTAKLAFIIDPVDGTWNFANELSVFGVMLAVVEKGVTTHGFLYDPLQDDWMVAERGQGAWHQDRQGERHQLEVSGAASLSEASGFVSLFSFDGAMQRQLAPKLAGFARLMAFGCSCFEYRLLSAGRANFLLAPNPKVWDHAAGSLIVQEAGGYCAFIDGEPYSPLRRHGLLLCASDKQMWQQLVAHFALNVPSYKEPAIS